MTDTQARQPATFRPKISELVSNHRAERIAKTNNYPERLARTISTLDNHVLQVAFHLKKKEPPKILTVDFDNNDRYVRKYLFLESGYSNDDASVYSCDLKQFLNLKQEKKRVCKKYLRQRLFLAPLSKSTIIMKTLAKIIARYNKNIVFVADQVLAKDAKEVMKIYQNRCYVKLEGTVSTVKLGLLREEPTILAERLCRLHEALINNESEVDFVTIKPSFGRVTTII